MSLRSDILKLPDLATLAHWHLRHESLARGEGQWA